jgi:hypothetical protein
VLVAPADELWDEVILVRYPNLSPPSLRCSTIRSARRAHPCAPLDCSTLV